MYLLRRIFLLFLVVVIFIFSFRNAIAQEDITASGVAVAIPIDGEGIINGSVICNSDSGLVLCDKISDQSMYGVVTQTPSAAFESDLAENAYLVMTDGKAQVRVSGAKGSITAGDLITSSDVPGVAVGADRNGYMLGTALQDFEGDSGEDQGLILVNISIHPSTGFTDDGSNLLEVLRQGLASPLLTPLSALRYFLAAFVTIISFVLSFVYFGRLSRTAVEAIGRNPLAQNRIQFTVLIHLIITLLIASAGLLIAYLILTI